MAFMGEMYYLTIGEKTYKLPSSGGNGTVTSVGVSNATNGGLSISGSPITSSGTITIGLATGYGDTKNPYASKTKNYVLAAPSTANGVPTFRALVAADIPISDWAKASSKPSYNFSEIGSKPTTLSGYGITDAYTKTQVDGLVSGVLHYKGTKTTVSALPTSGNTTGDVWHVTADGSEWAWDGSAWQELGTAVDLSGYAQLAGASFTGPVTFGDSVTADELETGDLVVTGAASFTNNISANTINGVTVGNSPKFTDTTYSSLTAASGGTAVSLVTTGEKYTWNNKQDKLTNPVTGTGTSGYLAKWNGTGSITNGPQLGSTTTTYLNNAGSWATPPGTATGHTHSLSIAASTGTSSVSLAANTKYQLSAGNNTYIFTTPPVPTKTSDLTNDSGFLTSYIDTKNTAGSTNSTSKLYLIGATEQSANPQTYSNNNLYYDSINGFYVKSPTYSNSYSCIKQDDYGCTNIYAYSSSDDMPLSTILVSSSEVFLANRSLEMEYNSSIFINGGDIYLSPGANDKHVYIYNLGAPSNDTDAATKKYVDDSVGAITITDEKLKWTASTSSNTYYPLQSTSTATTSTANTLNGISFYQYYNTAGGYRRLDLGNSTAYKSTGGAYGTIRLYGAAATYYGDLVPGVLGTTSGDGHISANRTWTLPDKTGTIALTSDIPSIPTSTGSSTTGITASTTATKTTLGTAFTIPNVTSAGSASTWAFEDIACDDITSWSAGSGSASISGAVDSSDSTQLNITISHTHTAPSLSYTARTVSSKKSGANGSAPTLGTAFTVPNVTGNTSATVSISDSGHTHTLS